MALQTINIGASPNDGSGDPLRTAMDKINDTFGPSGTGVFDVTHSDYGALGNGVANDTTAINAASAAASAAGGGIVRFSFVADNYNFTFTLPDAGVRWEFDGCGDLIDRSKLGGSAGMRASKAMLVHFPGPHTSFSHTANHIRVIADGSTQNGPASADFGQTIHVEKKDYLTTTVAGSCTSPLRIIVSPRKPGKMPPYHPIVRGLFAMIPHHFYYQLVVLGLRSRTSGLRIMFRDRPQAL